MGKMAKKGHRISFYIPEDMSKRVSNAAHEAHQTLSDFARDAIQKAIEAAEEAKLDQQLIEGYKANYQYYKNEAKAWESIERELP